MAIDAYVGLPGHGKSYGVVQHVIIPSLKQGRHVITNIPLNVDMLLMDYPDGQITQLPEDWFEREDLASLFPNGSVAVLDELWRRWPQAMTSKQAPMADKALLAEHRHMVDAQGRSMRIVFITQDLGQIASFARVLVEQTFRVVKMVELGMRGRYRVDMYRGPVTGQNPPKSSFIRSSGPHKYLEKIYRYYKSATKSETGDVGDESKADNRASVWRSPMLWIALVFGTLAPIAGLWQITGFFSGKGIVEQPAEAQTLTNPPPPGMEYLADSAPGSAPVSPTKAPAPELPPEPKAPAVSTAWRVGAFVEPSDDKPSRWSSVDGYNTGVATKPSKRAQVVLTGPAGTRIIPLAECDREGHYATCMVDGEVVTFWSGQRSSVVGALQTGVQSTAQAGVRAYEQREGASTAAGAVNRSPSSI